MGKCAHYIQKIMQMTHPEKFLLKDHATLEMVETLYRRQNKRLIFLQIWRRRLVILAATAAAAGLVFAVCLCRDMPDDVIVDGHYLRAGSGREQVTFEVRAETSAGTASDEITVTAGREEPKEDAEPVAETPDPRKVLLADIREAVDSAVSEGGFQNEGERVELPGTVSGIPVTYHNPPISRDFSAFYLCLFVIGLLPVVWRRQRQAKLREREQQLMLDYPELVDKIMLLLSAGLTVRTCFERMSEEYRRRMENGGQRRFVYEEVSFSLQEMQNGVSESKAIETFGKRCCQLPYLRFSSMLNQNIQKGSEGLIRLLEIEAMEAFEKRKEQVKAMGETAGTKLLLPMVLMLGIVMAIIIIPAFMTM